jgi:hypothetical protein
MLRPFKQAKKSRLKPLSLLLVALLISVISIVGLVKADTIVRGYSSKTSLQPGWVVALSEDAINTVEAVPAKDSSKIYGVVVDPSKAPVTLQPNQGQRVFVATSGAYPVLVNTQNGPISPGDLISMSNTDGIGAKANNQESTILGQALESFDGKTNVIATGEGGAAIGRVNVNITPGKNPLVKSTSAVPSVLRRAGEAIAGKNVTAVRIYAALVIFLVTAFIAGMVLWTGVRSGIISIGRNPLSRHLIFKGLIQVIIVAVIVFVIGLFAVYLLLKL